MPFVAIRGSFVPSFGTPDGDSVHFRPDDPGLLRKLAGRPPSLTSAGTCMLRFEGIDAVEKKSAEPWASASRDSMIRLIGSDVAKRRDARGFILSRTTDENRRPIAWLFRSTVPAPDDGTWVHLDAPLVRRSVNWWQIRQGWAYPLFYNTLFAELRETIRPTVRAAMAARRGIWAADATTTGVPFDGAASLGTMPPIWPKLWRRLEAHARTNQPGLEGFLDAIAATGERLDLLSTTDETGLENLLVVEGNTLRMIVGPNDVRVRSRLG